MPVSPSASTPPHRRVRHLRAWVTAGATAAGLTALATAGLAGTAGTAAADHDDHTVLLADSYGTRTIVVDGHAPGATPDPGATPGSAPAAANPAPQMRLQLAYKRTGPHLALTVNLTGFVYEPLDANGKPMSFPTPATAAIGLGQDLSWGDGTGTKAAADTGTCGQPANLHEVKDSFTLEHTYKAPGEYNVVYTFRACGLTDGKITATLPIRVGAAAPAAPATPPPA